MIYFLALCKKRASHGIISVTCLHHKFKYWWINLCVNISECISPFCGKWTLKLLFLSFDTMNNTAINTQTHDSWYIRAMVSLKCLSNHGIRGFQVHFYMILIHWFSEWLCHFIIPPVVCMRFQFSISSEHMRLSNPQCLLFGGIKYYSIMS